MGDMQLCVEQQVLADGGLTLVRLSSVERLVSSSIALVPRSADGLGDASAWKDDTAGGTSLLTVSGSS
jgi:hypothetical protein